VAIWLIAGAGAGLLNQALKYFYDRPRPPFKDLWVYESNQSFPSGHSLGSLVVFGLLAYLLALLLDWRGRAAVLGGTGLLILTIGFSRIYLGAHYFSDVLGGFCVGAAWLGVCISAIESVRLHPRHGRPP
jgi:undecaprenyl-diphosphatase